MSSLIVRMNPHHLAKIGNGKTITLTPDDLDNGEHVVKIIFREKKHATKLLNNHSKGKGTRLNPEHIEDAELHEIEGGRSFWNKIKSAGQKAFDIGKTVVNSKITKGIVKEATPILKQGIVEGVSAAVGAKTNPVVGKVVGQAAGNAFENGSNKYTGSGVKRLQKYPPTGGSFGPLGGSFKPLGSGVQELQSGTSLGGTNVALKAANPTSIQERMAHVRSFRKGIRQ